MTNTEEFITVDGVRLECAWINRTRSAGKPHLVFLHEGLGCVALWRNFPQLLSDTLELPAFVYSRQGYGGSAPIALPRPVDFMHHEGLNVLPRVLDEAGIESAILVGHSDGASISIINTGGTGDPRIRGVVLLAAHIFNEEITVKSIEEAKVAFETTDLREKLKKYHGDNVDCAFWGWNGVWLNPDFLIWNIEEFLPKIAVPALAIQGEDDQYGTEAQVQGIAAGLGDNCVVKMISNCGHSPHLEQSEQTLSAIVDFVRPVAET